jgi:N-carbamoyl-L-amino-acid hydrolase
MSNCISNKARLERAGVPLGVVTGILSVRWYRVVCTGMAAHAGHHADGRAQRCDGRRRRRGPYLADHCPTAMIFVPSKDEISHNAAEATEPHDLLLGVQALAYTVVALAIQ